MSALAQRHRIRHAPRIHAHHRSDILSWVLPTLLFFGGWMFVIRRFGQGASGLMAIGKSGAKIYIKTNTKVTFADVAGAVEAKEGLKEVVEFLKDPKAYRIPKGVLHTRRKQVPSGR